MKKYIFAAITAAIALCAYYYIPSGEVQPAGHYRIAVLTPVTHAALEEIILGFKETLGKNLPCTFDIYNAEGDRVLLQSQAEKIAQDTRYNLALVVATQPSIIMKEVVLKRGSQLPIVCAAVDDPVKNGLVHSLESSGNTFTTVTESMDKKHYQLQLDFLKKLFPHIKKLLLVYTPNVMLDREKDLLDECSKEHGIELTLLPIFACHELAQKASSLMLGQDCVIVLKDNTIVSCIETLVMLCNRMHIPLYASDLNSLKAGATCAYGVHEYQFGMQAAHQAYAILHDKKKPSTVASSRITQCRFVVNQEALKILGMPKVSELFEVYHA